LQTWSAFSPSSAASSPRPDPRTRRCRSPNSSALSSPSNTVTSQRCASKCKQQPLAGISVVCLWLPKGFVSHCLCVCSLFSLYNLLPSPYGKAFVYKKALELATAGKAAEYIIPSFKNIDSFVSEWGIDNLEKRELYLAITTILKDHKG
jgi:hypothetical protein